MTEYASFRRASWRVLLTIIVFLFLWIIPSANASANTIPDNEKCLQCHGNPGFSVEKDGQTKSLFVESVVFESSVHGFSKCSSCHTGGEVFPHLESIKIKRDQISETCSQCHIRQTEEYNTSLHAIGLATCADCHGSHDIQKQSSLPISQQLQNQVETCSQCHQGRVLESYQESFHGKAISLGGTKVPSCVSCHGAHSVLGSDDPISPIAKANIPQTCASCHVEPKANMAAGSEHFLLEREGPGKPMFYTYKFFTWLTIITITLLIIHIELELYRRYRDSKR